MTMEEHVGLIQRRDSTGRKYHCYQWRDSAGRRHTKSLKHLTAEEAKKVARDLNKKRRNGGLGFLDTSTMTLAQWRKRYLHDIKGTIGVKTYKRYDCSLRMLIEDQGEARLLRTITRGRLRRWAGQRKATGGRGGKGMSPAGVNTDLRGIKTALEYAHDEGWISSVPSYRGVYLPDPAKRKPRHLWPQQVSEFIESETQADWRRLWIAFFYTGCRRAELYNLNWEDIRWEPFPAARVTGKGGLERWVPLLPLVVEALGKPKDIGPVFVFRPGKTGLMPPIEELRAQAKEESPLALASRHNVSDGAIRKWLKQGYPYRRPHIDNFTKRFKARAVALGYKDARLHDTRHTVVTFLISQEIPPVLVQLIVGHSDLSITSEYAKGLLLMQSYDQLTKAMQYLPTERQQQMATPINHSPYSKMSLPS